MTGIGKLRKHGGDRRSGKIQGSNHYLESRGKPYILARLARDHPDIAPLAARAKNETCF
jgi:hypothetical protein